MLMKSWFNGVNHPDLALVVKDIDNSLRVGDMVKAVSLMIKADSLTVPVEGLEVIDKDQEVEGVGELDKGRRGALYGETRSMDNSGNEKKGGQKRYQMKRSEAGDWSPVPKPAPHESINPDDTYLSKKGLENE